MTLEAERSVLGSVMLSRAALEDCARVLSPDDFSWPRGAMLWHVITSMYSTGKPVDVVTVVDEVIARGLMGQLGGAEVPNELTTEVPTAANASYYAGIVRDAAVRRRIIEAGERIVAGAKEDATFVEDLVTQAGQLLDGAVRHTFELRTVGQTTDAIVQGLEQPPTYSPTIWNGLNDLIDGFRPGGLYVIGARPGAGKTIMGLQAAIELAKGGPVAFSSLEMSAEDLTTRLYANLGGISLTRLMRHDLLPDHWARIAELSPKVAKMPLYIDDRSRVTVSQVRAHARMVQSREGKLRAVVVDYLQLLGSESRAGASRQEVVGDMSRSLKIMAKEMRVPVIALAQLNRGTEMGAGRLPTLADLRESGNIEQDADVVLLNQRRVPEDQFTPGEWLDVVVAKNRHGRTGHVELVWEGLYARVVD